MLNYTELKPGIVAVVDGDPCLILEANFLRMQQRKAVVQTKFRNLKNGKVFNRNIHPNESLEEADVVREQVKFLYNHRDEYWFADINDQSKRFKMSKEIIGDSGQFLKPNTEITAIKFNDEIINIKLPIKIDLTITETPPGERGDTATGGRKAAILESGAKVMVPLFLNEGDVIRVNTETGEYVERVEKK